MTDNVVTNAGAGGETFATDDVGGVHYPISKIAYGALDSATLVSPANGLPVAVIGTAATSIVTEGTHFQPGYDLAQGVGAPGTLLTDPDGNLVARAQVLTDEGSYRVNFANSSLAVSLGSATFTNGSTAVTGAGLLAADVRTGDYVKLDADAESAWVQVSTVNSATSLTLDAAYTGTGGTGASSRAIVKPSTGSGGSITVSSGQCLITSGTTTGSITEIERDVDWLPLVKQAGFAVSQRIANQGTYIGFYDESAPTAPKWFAWFVLDGTTNTTVKCQSARNPTAAPVAAEIEETTITLPNGQTSAIAQRYRTEVLGDRCCFYVNSVLVATHFKSMPGPGDLLTSTVRIVNGTAPATSTTVTVDYDAVINHNKLQVGLMSDSEQVVALAVPLQSFSYTFTGIIAINTDLIVLDCSQLRSLYIQCAAMGTSGVVTVQWCNEPTFAVPITATLLSEAGATSTTFNAAVMRVTNVIARYCRLRLTTATTALTTTINAWGAQTTYTPIVTTQPVSGTVGVTGNTAAAASADALANPTIMQIGADAMNFNGTTWDRQRGNANITVGDTGAKTTSFFGATQTNFNARGAKIMILNAAVTGTITTYTAQLQISPDGGTTWLNFGPASTHFVPVSGNTILIDVYPTNESTAGATPAALTTGATQTVQINAALPRTWRISYVIAGTTPSITLTNAYAAYVN